MGVWKCWTHNCHEKYGCGIVGLISAIKKIDKKEAFKLARSIGDGAVQHEQKTDEERFIENFRDTNVSNLDFSSIIKNTNKVTTYIEDLDVSPLTLEQYETFFYQKILIILYGVGFVYQFMISKMR